MAYGPLLYCRPSNITTHLATWTATSGTLDTDPNYGASALYDGKMARPCKFVPGLSDFRLVGDFGAARRIDGMAMPNSNLAVGSIFIFQANAANVWTAPTLSVPFLVTSLHGDGHMTSPWTDFRSLAGYSALGFRYASIFFQASSLARAPWIGELLTLGTINEFSVSPKFDDRAGRRRPSIEHLETEFGFTRGLRRKIKQRTINTSLRGNTADRGLLDRLIDDACGNDVPFWCVHDSLLTSDGGLFGRFPRSYVDQYHTTNHWYNVEDFPFEFIEDSRGVPFV